MNFGLVILIIQEYSHADRRSVIATRRVVTRRCNDGRGARSFRHVMADVDLYICPRR